LERKGAKVALLSFGITLQLALKVGESLDATVVNMRYVKPLDTDMIMEMASSHDILVTIEENMIAGGAGSAVNEVLALHGRHLKIANYGLPDRLIQHGTRDDMLLDAGLTEEAFAAFVKARL
jgi:1-deoxy-D-xylulose-5-phosphate synthase